MSNKFLERLIDIATNSDKNNAVMAVDLFSTVRLSLGKSTYKQSYETIFRDEQDSAKATNEYFEALGFLQLSMGGRKFFIKTDTFPHLLVTRAGSTSGMRFVFHGDYEEITALKQQFSERFASEGVSVSVVNAVDPGTRIAASISTEFCFEKPDEIGYQSFYPFLKLPMEEYFKKFYASKQNVLILIGPPGTGKSTFLRTMILRTQANALLAFTKGALTHPELMRYFSAHDHHKTLIMEDVDRFIGARKDGNELMTDFLNTAEGIVPIEKKLVFSTNLDDLSQVDPALLRPGRCFDVLYFDLLTQTEAEQILLDRGMKSRDFSKKDYWPLAEVLNDPEEFLHLEERALLKKNRAGFI